MAILNYTTNISVEQTSGEIQSKLVKAKASAVLNEYDATGILSHISFKVQTQHGIIAFRLPGNIDGVHKALQKQRVRNKLQTKEQAARVAWRIVKDWVEAQLAIIEAGMVTVAEVFLPYAQTSTGQTVYECFEKKGLSALTYQTNNNPKGGLDCD